MEDNYSYYAQGYNDAMQSEILKLRWAKYYYSKRRRRQDGITKALVAIPFLMIAYLLIVRVILPFYSYSHFWYM